MKLSNEERRKQSFDITYRLFTKHESAGESNSNTENLFLNSYERFMRGEKMKIFNWTEWEERVREIEEESAREFFFSSCFDGILC